MLLETIRQNMREAKIAKDTLKANLLSTLYSEMFTQSKNGRQMKEEDEIKIIRKFIKNADDTIALDVPEETKNKLRTEKEILEHYLPKQLSRDEIDKIVTEMVSEGKTVKEIMPYFKEKYSGMYDGKTVNEIIKSKSS
jgi:uncharacterized protein YqeY